MVYFMLYAKYIYEVETVNGISKASLIKSKIESLS